MLHRRQLAFVITVAAVGAAVWLSFLRDDRLERIRVGMTYGEVKAIMGEPGLDVSEIFAFWRIDAEHLFVVYFDANRRVSSIQVLSEDEAEFWNQYVPPLPTLWDRIRNWLGL